jgi:hypothetical protein
VRSAAPASPRSEFNAGDPNGKKETLGPQPCHPAASSLYPLLSPMAPEEESLGRSPNSGRLASKKGGAPSAALCPLCQAPGPPLPQADGSYTAGPMQHVYQPFTTSDLLNWQQHSPAYSEEPQAVRELLANIMHSHQPNLGDCCPLMSTFFTSDEHRRVHEAARAWRVTQAPLQTANPERRADERIPDTRPDWDPNTPDGLQSIST